MAVVDSEWLLGIFKFQTCFEISLDFVGGGGGDLFCFHDRFVLHFIN